MEKGYGKRAATFLRKVDENKPDKVRDHDRKEQDGGILQRVLQYEAQDLGEFKKNGDDL